MNASYLKELQKRVGLSRQSRRKKLTSRPWKTLAPVLLKHANFTKRAKAALFFDEEMEVILPEPISTVVWRYGYFEEDVSFYLLDTLSDGDSFIDIGGHFGFFSILANKLVGSSGNIITFEPMPTTRDVLKNNITSSTGKKKRYLIAGAAGDERRQITFKDFGIMGAAYATSGDTRNNGFGSGTKVDVDMFTVDEIVADLGLKECRLMKIDAENSEYEVVQGALNTVRKMQPDIIIETGDSDDNDPDSSSRRVIDVLLAEGYSPYEFDDWSLRKHEVKQRYGYQNLLMVSPMNKEAMKI